MSGPLIPLIPGFPLTNREENIRLAILLLATLQDHGSRGTYAMGCRCDWCRSASRQYEDAWAERTGTTRAERQAARRVKNREDREIFVKLLQEEDDL